MNKPSLLDDYLEKYSAGRHWKPAVRENDAENIFQIVVIPSYAERETLPATLLALAANQASSLEYSLILCVVNNKINSGPSVIEDNQKTIEYLDALVKKQELNKFSANQNLFRHLSAIADSKLKIGYIDASSKGYEMPQGTGGVGMARKIGMDTALRLLKNVSYPGKLIISLDADTLVEGNYLSAIKNYFTPEIKTAIAAYQHQMPDNHEGQAAICCYEIFLRYWVLGLKYAKSPWAFHSIGSTIVTTADAYLQVRGMNRRAAGEDFYFLNKLAKIGGIGYIQDTCVYPSARASARVPFGTGKAIQRFLEGGNNEYQLYDPRIFIIISRWLEFMNSAINSSEEEILKAAENIHPALKLFLEDSRFADAWSKIRRNAKEEKTLRHHFNDWFDGFKTYKLINYLTSNAYSKIDMFEAVATVLSLTGDTALDIGRNGKIPAPEEQIRILRHLRKIT